MYGSTTGVGSQHIHHFTLYKNWVLDYPYADTFLILAHGMYQSRFPRSVVHLEATRATAEFLAWVLYRSSYIT